MIKFFTFFGGDLVDYGFSRFFYGLYARIFLFKLMFCNRYSQNFFGVCFLLIFTKLIFIFSLCCIKNC